VAPRLTDCSPSRPNSEADLSRPVLLYFDGSEEASAAIARAAKLLRSRTAVVLTVWETGRNWDLHDPATVLSAPLAKLASAALHVDDAVRQLAVEEMEHGVALARAAGFDARGRVELGRTWRVVCQVAEEIDAAVIVVTGRLLHHHSLLLRTGPMGIWAHAGRPVLVLDGGSGPVE
jgi:nucleotide-binding universal stress UspA family protein